MLIFQSNKDQVAIIEGGKILKRNLVCLYFLFPNCYRVFFFGGGGNVASLVVSTHYTHKQNQN